MKKLCSGLILAAIVGSGCGDFKDPDRRIISVGPEGAVEKPDVEQMKDHLDDLKSLFILYGGDAGFSKSQITNILYKLKDKLAALIPPDLDLSIEEYVDLLFEFDSDGNQRLTWNELINGVSNKSPTLRWLLENTAPTAEQIKRLLFEHFGKISDVAIDGLIDALFLFDSPNLGGNSDGKLQPDEISLSGLVLTFLEKAKCVKKRICAGDVTPTPGELIPILQKKVNKQLFARYKEADHEKLPDNDANLEIVQLGVRYLAIEKLIRILPASERDPIRTEEDASRLFAIVGRDEVENWRGLRAFFDGEFAAGNGDGGLSSFEAFNLITEYDFAAKIYAKLQKYEKDWFRSRMGLLDTLEPFFPSTYLALHFEVEHRRFNRKIRNAFLRRDYFREARQIEQPRFGGNGNGVLEPGEFTLILGYAEILEFVFSKHDADKDGSISRRELATLFRSMDVREPKKAANAFFAGIVMGEGGWLTYVLDKIFGPKKLAPHRFYSKMKKQLRVLFTQSLGRADGGGIAPTAVPEI